MSTVAAVESFVASIVCAVMDKLEPIIVDAIDRAAVQTAQATREKLEIRELKPVMSYEETCDALHISRDHGDRLRKDGTFPVAPLDPPISTRDLYAGEDVIAAIRSRGSWQQSKKFLKVS
jgi:hypothetical protein